MANYSVKDIKELRELTGAGMMDVKKALEEANGDRDEAMKIIRLAGQKSLAKREGRTAAAGVVAIEVKDTEAGQLGIMVEVNSETDFVAKNEKFLALVDTVKKAAVSEVTDEVEKLMTVSVEGKTVQEHVDEMAALFGERIVVGRVGHVEGEVVDAYLHYSNKDLPPQVGVLVATDKAAASVAHDVALHIAGNAPQYLTRDDIPEDVVAKERETLEELTRQEGKPEHIVPKIVEGRLNGFYKEVCLVDQDSAKDPKLTIGKLITQSGGKVLDYKRFHVGA
ncbi:MAG: translation elongation factor Ts [Actinomycetaceae bacterium]|nr:translation elongation factor Ts [Actinomycetaceae bacterium]